MNVSYSIPVGLLLFRGRHLLLPPSFPEPTMTRALLSPSVRAKSKLTRRGSGAHLWPDLQHRRTLLHSSDNRLLPLPTRTSSHRQLDELLRPASSHLFPSARRPLTRPARPIADAVVVFGIIFIVATITWFLQGRKHFQGPRDLGGLLELARTELVSPPRDVEWSLMEKVQEQ